MKNVKKLLIAAVGASLLAAPAAFAAPHQGFDAHGDRAAAERVATRTTVRTRVVQPRYQPTWHEPARFDQARRWSRGERFDYRQVRDYRVIANPRAYRLHEAPRGYRWVKADNDFLLKGDVFTMDQIEAYLEIKWEEVSRWETTPSPVEFDMYYSA